MDNIYFQIWIYGSAAMGGLVAISYSVVRLLADLDNDLSDDRLAAGLALIIVFWPLSAAYMLGAYLRK